MLQLGAPGEATSKKGELLRYMVWRSGVFGNMGLHMWIMKAKILPPQLRSGAAKRCQHRK